MVVAHILYRVFILDFLLVGKEKNVVFPPPPPEGSGVCPPPPPPMKFRGCFWGTQRVVNVFREGGKVPGNIPLPNPAPCFQCVSMILCLLG